MIAFVSLFHYLWYGNVLFDIIEYAMPEKILIKRKYKDVRRPHIEYYKGFR